MDTLVPSANKAITRAPSTAWPVRPATNNAEYSKPQGRNVQRAPTTSGAPRHAPWPGHGHLPRFFVQPAPSRRAVGPSTTAPIRAPPWPRETCSRPGAGPPTEPSTSQNPAWTLQRQRPVPNTQAPAPIEKSTWQRFCPRQRPAQFQHRPRHTWQYSGGHRPSPSTVQWLRERFASSEFKEFWKTWRVYGQFANSGQIPWRQPAQRTTPWP